jgi:hypothetical protein
MPWLKQEGDPEPTNSFSIKQLCFQFIQASMGQIDNVTIAANIRLRKTTGVDQAQLINHIAKRLQSITTNVTPTNQTPCPPATVDSLGSPCKTSNQVIAL